MISNKRKWYQFHAGTQGGLYGGTKGRYNCLKVILKIFISTELQYEHMLIGIWYRWICINQIQLPWEITGLNGACVTSDTTRIIPRVL